MSTSGVDNLETYSLDGLYRKYAGLVYRRCLRLLGNQAKAEEAMQDVFVKILNSDLKVEQHPRPSALLFRIATHTCLNLIRSSRRHPETLNNELLLDIADSQTVDLEPTHRLFVETILKDEDESTRMMATYHYIDGMTLEELAQEFDMSVSGIRKRLQKFKASAQKKGADYGEP